MMIPGKPKLWLAGALAVVTLIASMLFFGRGEASVQDVPVFAVQKGPLQVDVLEGGEIRALENFEVKSEIEIPTKIISLIPEGYLITEDDVKDGKVLVELDPSELKQKITDHEIDFQTTVAAYIEADEQREIQRSENQSLFIESKQAALFALMDFEKYLGKQAAVGILKSVGLPENTTAFEQHIAALEVASNIPVLKSDTAAGAKGDADRDAAPTGKAASSKKTPPTRIDFLPFLENNALEDGEAQQKLRQLNDELLLHKAELAVAKQTVESSERLAKKNFVTQAALENDQVNFEKVSLSVKTAETSLDLFRKYEFPKQCETFLSAYREALHKTQRTIRANRSKLAQAESKFQTAKRRYEMQLDKKEDLDRQLKACVIRAQQPGLVAYGDLNANPYYRYNEPIEEGANVRLRQTMLTIPDMSQMGVRLNVHESQVKKVRLGQKALIRVDAEPNKTLEGKVAELAVLPDSSSTRFTPNVKVYPCTIHISGAHEWLKPGMNAKVEIIIDQLAEVLFVPVQSIEVEDDRHFCYVNTGSRLERREVSTGVFNDEFIEVRTGLQPGEEVALSIPTKGVIEGQQPAGTPESEPITPKPKKEPTKGKEIARS